MSGEPRQGQSSGLVSGWFAQCLLRVARTTLPEFSSFKVGLRVGCKRNCTRFRIQKMEGMQRPPPREGGLGHPTLWLAPHGLWNRQWGRRVCSSRPFPQTSGSREGPRDLQVPPQSPRGSWAKLSYPERRKHCSLGFLRFLVESPALPTQRPSQHQLPDISR